MSLKTLPRFTAIAACDPRGVMGKNGALPWHCPADLLHFRNTTLGAVMVMGHTTFLLMPEQAFQDRNCIVFTKQHSIDPKMAIQVANLNELSAVYSKNKFLLNKIQFVIGGAAIFNLFFEHNLIEKAIISHFHQVYEGDTFFPLHFIEKWKGKVLGKHEEFSIVEHTPK